MLGCWVHTKLFVTETGRGGDKICIPHEGIVRVQQFRSGHPVVVRTSNKQVPPFLLCDPCESSV